MKMINEQVKQSVQNVLDKERLFRYDCESAGESETALLEKKFAEVTGSKYAIAMNSCSSALFVSLLCAGVEAGDRVAVPAFTFIAVPSSIVHAGAQPVLIEVDENYVMDLDDFEKKVKDGSVKALMLSYMRGRMPDLDRVIELCNKYNVVFLEDSAHSLGILWKGVQTGTLGLAGSYSAQSYKMIDGGEGGIMVTDDKEVAFKAMLYAGCYEHNWKKHFGTEEDEAKLLEMTSSIPAYNFRMSNLSAAALIPQLDEVEARVENFNAKYNRLVEILSQSEHIRVPKFTEGMRPAADSVQWEFQGLSAEQIDAIKKDLAQNGVKIEVFTGSNARCFWNWTYFEQNEECPFTKDMLQRTVDMRLRLYLTIEDIEQIGQNVLDAIERNS
jgi:dTDP-4-amino-4,6-dideoxygalactose transaminase